MTVTTLAGRVPLAVRHGGQWRTVAAIPTPTPGLYVHWRPALTGTSSYAIATAHGHMLAYGWTRTPLLAVETAADLADIADWEQVTRDSVLDLPLRAVKEIGEAVARRGGWLYVDVPACHLRAETDRLRSALDESEARIAELKGSEPYHEVWDGSLPPGGYVCAICGEPVESEPCPEHAPGVGSSPAGVVYVPADDPELDRLRFFTAVTDRRHAALRERISQVHLGEDHIDVVGLGLDLLAILDGPVIGPGESQGGGRS